MVTDGPLTCSIGHESCCFRGSTAAGDFGEMVEDLQATGLGQADVFVCPFGGARETQDGVAAGDESVGDGVEDFVVDGIARVFGSGFAEKREGQPFADERDVAGAIERQGCRLQLAEIVGHLFWVVVGAAAVRAGDEDHEGCGRFGHRWSFQSERLRA
jgi:hypothetical protein